ncbi:glycosyltransferase [Planomicrobium okeanokoites]|uniref:glycosyltransferase n=1 Tax=Planomicrobium okeanokoites TaxID=244 RepID=UPI0024902EAC|nr:glycosyltransferase [Planomicrobium okeanokoites]
MKKVLFITTRNILNTSGELRLIKNRAEAMYNQWGVETDYIVFATEKKSASAILNNIKGDMTIFSLNILKPLTLYNQIIKFKNLVIKILKSNDYQCVILSGIGTLSLVNTIKKYNKNIPVIADIHGADEDIKEFAKNKKISKKVFLHSLYNYSKISELKNLKKMDGIFVVTQALAKYLSKAYSLKAPNYYIVPCALNTKEIDSAAQIEYRKKYRKKYSVSSDEKLFVYSGGVSPWQCIEESIDLFNRLNNLNAGKYKMLILSHHLKEIIPLIKNSPNIITDSVESHEVNKILCAGDYGFLLREDIITNNVAFPNKFLEYVQSGMKIITTPYVYDIAEKVVELEIGIIIGFEKDNVSKLDKFIKSNKQFENWGKRKKVLDSTSFETTLADFIQDYKLN